MKTIPLTQGQAAIVDDDDYERLACFKWQAHFNRGNRKFYAVRHGGTVYVLGRTGQSKYRSRSVTMAAEVLGDRLGLIIDHANGDSLDNRRVNLRFATHSQNSCNRDYVNRTGYKGIFRNNLGKYTARVIVNKRKVSVGTFPSPEEAAEAYNEAASRFYGPFAKLNQIPNRVERGTCRTILM